LNHGLGLLPDFAEANKMARPVLVVRAALGNQSLKHNLNFLPLQIAEKLSKFFLKKFCLALTKHFVLFEGHIFF